MRIRHLPRSARAARAAALAAALTIALSGSAALQANEESCALDCHISAAQAEQVAVLEEKLETRQLLLDKYEKRLATKQQDLAEGQADLAAAQALPQDTAQELKARKKAIKAAKKKIAAAEKGVAKYTKKCAAAQGKVDQRVAQIEAIDPWHFAGSGRWSASATPYDPPWAGVAPAHVIDFTADPAVSDEVNGAALKAAIQGLHAGDCLRIGSGVYSINSYFNVSLAGSASAPIWIVAQKGARPVITRPNASQNVMNVGTLTPGSAQFLCFRGLEFRGGSAGVRLYGCTDVWLDHCSIHDTGEAALTANTVNSARLYITRNHIHHTSGYGEGMYLGANSGACVMQDSVIALNHVHHTSGQQGDGIEVKQGSFGNWIVGNCVHDTNYPCILAYGTYGNPVNTIERNVCFNSNDNVLQVQGEALVVNNLLMHGGNGFYSGNHQDSTRDLVFTHNTIINNGTAVYLASWSGKPGMVFANNVAYSEQGAALAFAGPAAAVDFAGNVFFGTVSGASASTYALGNGLSDFACASWSAWKDTDARPVAGCVIVGAGDTDHAATVDLSGAAREGALEAGCLDRPGS